MKKMLIGIVLAVLGLGLLVIVAGQLGLLAGEAPTNLGVRDGRLKPPSTNPNSVSSQANLYPDHPQRQYAAIEALRFQGDGEAALRRLAQQLEQTRGVTLVERKPDYLYAQCQTPTLKFTDDAEFWLDKAGGVIQVRSSSRLGRKDLGTNRARMEAIRARFQSGS